MAAGSEALNVSARGSAAMRNRYPVLTSMSVRAVTESPGSFENAGMKMLLKLAASLDRPARGHATRNSRMRAYVLHCRFRGLDTGENCRGYAITRERRLSSEIEAAQPCPMRKELVRRGAWRNAVERPLV